MSATALLQSCVTACATMQGHRDWVLCVEWSPDGKLLVSGQQGRADPGVGRRLHRSQGAMQGQAPPPPLFPFPALSYLFLQRTITALEVLVHTHVIVRRCAIEGSSNWSQPDVATSSDDARRRGSPPLAAQ